jgi:hypothetical protein
VIAQKPSYIEKARKAWGADLPDWIEALAKECDRTSGMKASNQIGYTNGVVSQVIANKYPGDMTRVKEKVRGALLGATVMCPVFGEFGRDRCLDEQKKGNTFTSESRGRCFRTCRGIGVPKCPHSRIPEGQR